MTTYQPLSLIAEITHRCPLQCVYCSNPLELKAKREELPLSEWERMFQEAAAMGIVQLHLTGGEPLARTDLTEMIRVARKSGLYTNLITSGIGLTESRLEQLVSAGLDHIQLSFQDVHESGADTIAGVKSHAVKLATARLIKKANVAFTVNIVVHRQNLDRLPEMIEMAESLGPSRLEIAHVQYNGWAFTNRESLLPTREQVEKSVGLVEKARERLQGKLRIDFVVPDYYAKYPKACMGGWAQKVILMDPSGRAMPCHSAGIIPGVEIPSFIGSTLKWIWNESPLFMKFRGDAWMKEPCKSCDRKEKDFGGCRCQAMLIAGDPTVTDPVCSLSPQRALVEAVIAKVEKDAIPHWEYRKNP